MQVISAKFDKDDSIIAVTDVGFTSGITETHFLWDAAVKVATPYVEPTIDPKVARANALAALDPLVAQITRYEILGVDATISKTKLATKVADIDQKYPA